MEGAQQDLITGLNKLCSTGAGLTFAAKISLNGQYEGRVILYEANKYPFNCIGPCRFLWKPTDEANSDTSQRKIWLWLHPSIYKHIQQELINIFELTNSTCDSTKVINENDDSPAVKKRKVEEKTTQNDSVFKDVVDDSAVWSNNTKTIQLKNLKDKLIRFKLLGPLSTTILANVVNVADLSKLEKNSQK
jgi:hypothetical protein